VQLQTAYTSQNALLCWCLDVNNDNLKMLVYGHIAGVDVPFPINNPNACKDSNITCPIVQGNSYSYRNVIFVKTEYPSVRLVLNCF
jgi:Niemann-Pick C2 protein